MARIAMGGFMHETNTFAPQRASYEDFERHDAWPGLCRGQSLLQALDGLNIGSGGFIAAARDDGHELVPLLWCSAEPSSLVTKDAFERICAMLIDDLRAAGSIDALYLDLHGAMVAEHHQDGEGELLRRVRDVVGADCPVIVSLDLHANVTEAMVEHADAITIYRTYPHVDMAETGRRAYGLLSRSLNGERFHCVMRKADYLIPLSAQCTDFEPSKGLYAAAIAMSEDVTACADIALGFPPADINECGPAVIACDPDRDVALRAAQRLFDLFSAAEDEFKNPLMTPVAAIAQAMASNRPGPTVIADAQDNSGAGATSDTTGVLAALVDAGARSAVLAALHDPQAAAAAHAHGVGAEFEFALGGRAGIPGQEPFTARFRVAALGDGQFTCTGPMLIGTRTALGPTALLSVVKDNCDVRVVVTTVRFQCLDQEIFRHVGIEPADERIVVVKSTVHFRADFDRVSHQTLVAESPGSHPCRLSELNYQNLRDGVRLEPMGPLFRR